MERRKFLRLLGIATAAPVLTAVADKFPSAPELPAGVDGKRPASYARSKPTALGGELSKVSCHLTDDNPHACTVSQVYPSAGEWNPGEPRRGDLIWDLETGKIVKVV